MAKALVDGGADLEVSNRQGFRRGNELSKRALCRDFDATWYIKVFWLVSVRLTLQSFSYSTRGFNSFSRKCTSCLAAAKWFLCVSNCFIPVCLKPYWSIYVA